MTDDAAKKAILARRTRFIAAAVASLGAAGAADGCSSAEPCLSTTNISVDTGANDSVGDGTGGDADAGDTAPTPCLSAPFDSGTDTVRDSSGDVLPDAAADGG